MKQFAIITLAAMLVGVPATAQDRDDTLKEGMGLLQEGTRLLLEGLKNELGPALQDLENMMIDLNAYHAPEVLPNGDIIIRRKSPMERDLPEDGEIEL